MLVKIKKVLYGDKAKDPEIKSGVKPDDTDGVMVLDTEFCCANMEFFWSNHIIEIHPAGGCFTLETIRVNFCPTCGKKMKAKTTKVVRLKATQRTIVRYIEEEVG